MWVNVAFSTKKVPHLATQHLRNTKTMCLILTTIISQSNSAHPFEKPFGNRVGIANSYTCLFDNRNIYLVF